MSVCTTTDMEPVANGYRFLCEKCGNIIDAFAIFVPVYCGEHTEVIFILTSDTIGLGL